MTKKALITGASRGIGKDIALSLGRQNIEIYATALSTQGVKQIENLLHDNNLKGAAFQLDVSDRVALEAFASTLKASNIQADILVNNAGITADQLLMKLKHEDWDKVMRTNLDSVFYLSKMCIRGMMKKRWGRIINIASVVGLTGNPGQSNYAASKAGMVAFSKSLAQEVATRNITVNCVAPGFIDTDMTRDLPTEVADKLKKNIPMGRLGSGREVASTVSFLASDDAAYITGETISVNGGLYMS